MTHASICSEGAGVMAERAGVMVVWWQYELGCNNTAGRNQRLGGLSLMSTGGGGDGKCIAHPVQHCLQVGGALSV